MRGKIILINLLIIFSMTIFSNEEKSKMAEHLKKNIIGYYLPKEKVENYNRMSITFHGDKNHYEVVFAVISDETYGDFYTMKCKSHESLCEFYHAKTKKLKYVMKMLDENTIQILQDKAPWESEIPKIKAGAIFIRNPNM